jgi:hypothetical protein
MVSLHEPGEATSTPIELPLLISIEFPYFVDEELEIKQAWAAIFVEVLAP